MMHTCPDCGMACDCDGEDTWLDAPYDCYHPCAEDDIPELYDDAFDGVVDPAAVARVHALFMQKLAAEYPDHPWLRRNQP